MSTFNRTTRKRVGDGNNFSQDTPSPKRARLETEDGDSAYVSVDDSAVDSLSSPVFSHAALSTNSLPTTTSTKRPKKYLCDFDGCHKAFDRPARLEIHVRSHTNERPFACTANGCDKRFLRSEHLKAHVKSKHNDERDYICNYGVDTDDNGNSIECGKKFHTGTRLRRHIAAHEEKEQTKCNECGRIFRKQETLQRHIKADHLNENAFRCQHVNAEGDAEGQAEECGQSFATVGQLKAHQSREHSGLRYFCDACVQPPIDDEIPQSAAVVGFVTYAELQAHLKLVHPPLCTICGQACESNRALNAHMDIEHSSLSDRQRFECPHSGCGRKFTKNGNLKVHIQTVHAKVKNFTCGEHPLTDSKKVEGWDGLGCGTSFGTKGSLVEHIRTQHLGLAGMHHARKKVKAESSSSELKAMLLGVGDATSSLTGFAYEERRPIACLTDGCSYRFKRQYDLATHLELYHAWNIDDINDCLAQGTVEPDEQFWIGGRNANIDPDQLLRQRLVESLSAADGYRELSDGDTEARLSVGPGQTSMTHVIDPVLAGH